MCQGNLTHKAQKEAWPESEKKQIPMKVLTATRLGLGHNHPRIDQNRRDDRADFLLEAEH